jgi:hypothetical protein
MIESTDIGWFAPGVECVRQWNVRMRPLSIGPARVPIFLRDAAPAGL